MGKKATLRPERVIIQYLSVPCTWLDRALEGKLYFELSHPRGKFAKPTVITPVFLMQAAAVLVQSTDRTPDNKELALPLPVLAAAFPGPSLIYHHMPMT